jgi:hypothetical protein
MHMHSGNIVRIHAEDTYHRRLKKERWVILNSSLRFAIDVSCAARLSLVTCDEKGTSTNSSHSVLPN